MRAAVNHLANTTAESFIHDLLAETEAQDLTVIQAAPPKPFCPDRDWIYCRYLGKDEFCFASNQLKPGVIQKVINQAKFAHALSALRPEKHAFELIEPFAELPLEEIELQITARNSSKLTKQSYFFAAKSPDFKWENQNSSVLKQAFTGQALMQLSIEINQQTSNSLFESKELFLPYEFHKFYLESAALNKKSYFKV